MYIPVEFANYINLFLIGVFLLFLISGYRKGFLVQLINLLGLIVAFFMAWMFSSAFGKMFALVPKHMAPFQETILADLFYTQVNSIAWFVVLFLVFLLIVWVIKLLAKGASKIPIIAQVNRILGMLFSVVHLVILSAVAIFVLSTPLFLNGKDIIDRSWLGTISKYTIEGIQFISKPLEESRLVQEFIENGVSQASTKDVSNMMEWLKDKGVDSQTIEDFLKELGG